MLLKKNIITKLIIFCLIINCDHKLLCQDLISTIKLGDQYFADGNYDYAISFYRRAFYFSDTLKTNISLKLAECYEITGETKNTEYFLNYAINNAPSDSIKTKYLFDKILYFMRHDKPNYALMSLYSINPYDKNIEDKILFFESMILFLNEDYKESYTSLLEYGENKFSDQTDQKIDEIYMQAENNAFKNPKKARILSMIVPGAGQVYNKDYQEAVNSFLLTGLFIVLYVNVIRNYGIFQGIIGIFPWYQRYYMGGSKIAYELTLNKKEQQRIKLYNELLDIIEKEYF